MACFLLDTNILSALMLEPQGRAARRAAQAGDGNICTSIIVAAELRYGAASKGSAALAARVEAVLAVLDILPLETPADVIYGDLRTRLAPDGTPIGANGLLIAAQALALNKTVVTGNDREFTRVPCLAVENWLR